ncbi:hypothetical protein KI387_001802, partial [Taxus chinensis]
SKREEEVTEILPDGVVKSEEKKITLKGNKRVRLSCWKPESVLKMRREKEGCEQPTEEEILMEDVEVAKNEVESGVMAALEVVENGALMIHHVTTSYEKNARHGEELDNMSMRHKEEMQGVFGESFDFHNMFDLCA